MRPKFGMWLDAGRADYGIGQPRLARAKRWGIMVVALTVGVIAVRNAYWQMGANSELDSLAAAARTTAIDTGRAVAVAPAAKPRSPPQTIGLAPIGATDRSAIVEPPPVAGPAAPAPGVQAAADVAGIDVTPAKVDENKLEKPRVAKKKAARSAPSMQIYEMPDGRQVWMRRPSRTDSRQAGGAGFDPWGFHEVPRSGQRFVARPGLFAGF
jgi:hypothetical protein